MNIVIGVGDSGSFKNSCDIAGEFHRLIRKYNVKDAAVSASYCIGRCSKRGTPVMIDGSLLNGVTAENAEEIFRKYV